MGNRLSKIYTRTGDDGSTGLGDGSRVAKENLRVEAYGTVDETNSAIGVVLSMAALPPNITPLPDRSSARPVRSRRRAVHSRTSHDRRGARRTAREGIGRIQRGSAAAQGIHPARRRPGGRRLSSRARDLPARRAPLLVAGARRKRLPRRAQIFEPPVRPAVRAWRGCSRATSTAAKWSGGAAPCLDPSGRQRDAHGVATDEHAANRHANAPSPRCGSGRQNRNPCT